MSDHHAPSGSSRTRLPRQPSTRASSSYHGSSAARAASHVSNRRPSGLPNAASAASSFASSRGRNFSPRSARSMSSMTTLRSSGVSDAQSIAAQRIATRPPIEWPTRTTPLPLGSREATAANTSLARLCGEKAASGPRADSPWPRRSSATAGYPAAARSASVPAAGGGGGRVTQGRGRGLGKEAAHRRAQRGTRLQKSLEKSPNRE